MYAAYKKKRHLKSRVSESKTRSRLHGLFIHTDISSAFYMRCNENLHFKKVTDVRNKYRLLHEHKIRKKWEHQKALDLRQDVSCVTHK